jgi:hypothetical protein
MPLVDLADFVRAQADEVEALRLRANLVMPADLHYREVRPSAVEQAFAIRCLQEFQRRIRVMEAL